MTDAKQQIVTPKGIVGPYPAIDRVDYGSNDYPDPDGSFKCELRLDRKDKAVKKLIAEFDSMTPDIEAEAKAFKANMLKKKGKKVDVNVNPMYSTVYDEEGEDTGMIAIKAKTKASGTNKKTGKSWERKLPVRDAKGTLIKGSLGISTGSTVKMAITVGDIYANSNAGAGRALFLDQVMLYDLVQYGGPNPFGDEDIEEDGYVFDASDVQEETQKEPDNAFTDEEDDDEEPDFAS